MPDLINIADCIVYRCGRHGRDGCGACIGDLKRESMELMRINEEQRTEIENGRQHVCPAYRQAVEDSVLKAQRSRLRTALDLILLDDLTPNKILKEVRRALKDVEEMERNR